MACALIGTADGVTAVTWDTGSKNHAPSRITSARGTSLATVVTTCTCPASATPRMFT